jgi:hypothetical protein
MAATHTYVVTQATAVNDVATIVGTVDTIPTSGHPVPVTVTMWLSAIVDAKNVSMASLEALVGPVMLAAAQTTSGEGITPLPPPAPATISQLPTGTFTL